MEIIKVINIPDIFFRKLSDIELSVRTYKALTSDGIIYIGDLVQKTEKDLLHILNFGPKCLREIKYLLSYMKLDLGMQIENWTEENKKIALGQVFNSSAEILTQLKQLHIRLNDMSEFLEKIEDNIVLSINN